MLVVVLHLVILLLNQTCGLQQQNLNCFLDSVDVSRNLFSVQLNATDDGQKSVTFGVNEVASLLDSQVKYMLVQCLTAGRRLLESLLYVRLLQILGRCLEQLHIFIDMRI